MKTSLRKTQKHWYSLIARSVFVFSAFIVGNALYGQTQKTAALTNDGNKLLDEYFKSKGYTETIVFDASNIKQFWTDLSVFSKDDLIHVIMNDNTNRYVSKPQKIQLANVNETQECIVNVVSSSDDYSVDVLNANMKSISRNSVDEVFIDKKISTTEFDLMDTDGFTFYLSFSSKNTEKIKIDKIILSFADKKDYTRKIISSDDLDMGSNTYEQINRNSFSVTGKKISLLTSNFYSPASGKKNAVSMKIKNIGETQTKIYVGYMVFNKEKMVLNDKNYPYSKKNKSFTVVKAEEGDDRIIVNTKGFEYFWRKAGGCYLAFDTKEDLSDIPNVNLLSETLKDIRPLSDDEVEITLDKPLSKELKKDTKIRIHGVNGPQLYYKVQNLAPGEEITLSNHIGKDENNLSYSIESFSKGVYYFKPLIYSYSVDPAQENTILISDYTIVLPSAVQD